MIPSDEPVTLQTTFCRYYAASMLPVLAGMLAGSSIVAAWAGNGAWLLPLGTAVGGAAGTFFVCGFGVARARVELRDGTLDAPAVGFSQRLVIPIERIDTARSSERSIVQRLLGERALWTRDGRRVLLNERWFAPGALMDLWVRLGCQP
jgi:hypothetical protein